MIPINRYNSMGEPQFMEYYQPFEELYRELKRRYPKCEGWPRSDAERLERRRLREENIWSKMTSQ